MNIQLGDISYSLRRYYVDNFYSYNIEKILPESKIIDLGGKKINKRGQFNLEKYNFETVYVNISKDTEPDILADINNLPVKARQFDVVICSEVLEHIKDPISVLKESYRILRPGGILLICIPFLFRIHGDPMDYGRYTNYWWKDNLSEIGFSEIEIEKQGLFWSVLIDMIRDLIYQMSKEQKPKFKIIRYLLNEFVTWGKYKAVIWDKNSKLKQHYSLGSYTTGFGIKAVKINPNTL